MSNFIAGHHSHSGIHVMDHRANTDACTPFLRWYRPVGDKKVCFPASQKHPMVHMIHKINRYIYFCMYIAMEVL